LPVALIPRNASTDSAIKIKLTAHIDREIAARPELIRIENGWRNAREQRHGAVQPGYFREIETVVENPDAVSFQ
jgi:ParB family chromosome partitioning protein